MAPTAELPRQTLQHGDFAYWHTQGPAMAHKVLGCETDRYGVEKLILWDKVSMSVWSDRSDRFRKYEAEAPAHAVAA